MVFWKTQPTQVAPSATSAGMDHTEGIVAEVDEEPDERKQKRYRAPAKSNIGPMRPAPLQNGPRRESLLTRQLHSETEHSDDDHVSQPPRALSTQSTWSNMSTASTAELTSDDGHSVPSPAISPPLPPTQTYGAIPVHNKPLDRRLKIVGEEDAATSSDGKGTGSEKSVEATLGRKRCIMFSCRSKEEAKPKTPPPTSAAVGGKPAAGSPPKRKCMIKFACPSRTKSQDEASVNAPHQRRVSPPPMKRRTSSGLKPETVRSHRGSDSTVTHSSPRSVRKTSSVTPPASTPAETETPKPSTSRTLSNESDDSHDTGTEAMRFHEFASSDDEPEEWVKESTCHRSRLTITDTLQKENVIRKACEEVEDEVIEEDEEEAEDEAEDEADEVEGSDDDADEVEDEDEDEDEESEQSDAGFHSDDENGFAASDSEGEESDYEWWKPGGSTAATSVEHLDRIHIKNRLDDQGLASSLNSASSGELSPHTSKTHRSPLNRRYRRHSHAIPIRNRLEVDDELPDSTDFVCGTLDEDRPLEQAYINRVKTREAAKHKARPQDIDPTFPTSDPDMDEEDDEDLEDAEESDRENMMHGDMDELDGESTLRRPRTKGNRSPPPPARYHSPPPSRRQIKHVSPAPLARRTTARSPPPHKLFGQSPRRARSPAPARMTSPPNTRLSSPTRATAFEKHSRGLAERPQLTHTASLPRGGGFLLSRIGRKHTDEADSDDAGAATTEIPKRGAIDIVKGLERKRQRRKEKAWQKKCAAAKCEKAYKVKPGKGAARMREVGLQLQAYHGKGEHIISV